MKDYIKTTFSFKPFYEDAADLLASFLGDIGFESFTTEAPFLEAYIPANEFDRGKISEILESFPIQTKIGFTSEKIEGKNWNEEWEKNYFQPIVIGKRCVIHSSFHKDYPAAEYEIVVDPKMAFGTGHHSTTSGMIRLILEEDLEDKNVIDIGTGTAILAILASLRGAKRVDAIEIDPFAAENARENVVLNKTSVNVITGDAKALAELEKADILFANINRNIIIEDLKYYAERLKNGGTLLLSGFYIEDVPKVMEEAHKYNLILDKTVEDNNWVALRLHI